MDPVAANKKTRRQFLSLLAASPALPYINLPRALLQALQQDQNSESGSAGRMRDDDPDNLPPSVLKSMNGYVEQISSAKDAITIYDLESVAIKKLHVGHLSYLAGTEDQATRRANREGFSRYEIRVRRLVDISKIDPSVSLLGTKWNFPIIICPCGDLAAFDPEGEVAVARAAKTRKHLQALSTVASKSIEDVTAARGEPVWFQLYRNPDWSKTRGMLKRAEAAGSPTVVFTVDTLALDKREVMAKIRRMNKDFCKNCHTLNPNEGLTGLTGSGFLDENTPMGLTPPVGPPSIDPGMPTWDYVKRLKDATSMKVFVKGVVTREDAELALQHGADGVWISNHGGRSENSGRSTIECVPEVVAAVRGRAPVIVDGGFRFGGDIFKALALGATAVGVGRPYIWGLASFGQEGVEAALDILDTELQMVMRQAGTVSLAKITREYAPERFPWSNFVRHDSEAKGNQ